MLGRGVSSTGSLRLFPLKLNRCHIHQRIPVAEHQEKEQERDNERGPLPSVPLRAQSTQQGRKSKSKATNGTRFAQAGQEFEQDHEQFMQEALIEARKGASVGEVPVGAVMVCQGEVIARAHNRLNCGLLCMFEHNRVRKKIEHVILGNLRVESENDPTAHAEMICIRSTAKSLGGWRLLNSTLYVTLEPCPMCAGAILQARIGAVVWGAPNPLLGADGSWVSLFPRHSEADSTEQPLVQDEDNISHHQKSLSHPFNPDIRVRSGIMATECSKIMKEFFRGRRKESKTVPGKAPILSSVWSVLRKVFLKFLDNHRLS